MSETDLKELDSIIEKPCPMENGYTRGWQTKDIHALIKSKYGVSYGSRHVRRIISNLGFVRLVPRPRHKRYKKVLFILDKAPWHKNNLVVGYFNENKETIDYMFLPTGAPDLDPVEECWRQTREKKTANTAHNTVKELKTSLKSFWNKQPFTINMSNYLCP